MIQVITLAGIVSLAYIKSGIATTKTTTTALLLLTTTTPRAINLITCSYYSGVAFRKTISVRLDTVLATELISHFSSGNQRRTVRVVFAPWQ